MNLSVELRSQKKRTNQLAVSSDMLSEYCKKKLLINMREKLVT